jgi:hypothetical protein
VRSSQPDRRFLSMGLGVWFHAAGLRIGGLACKLRWVRCQDQGHRCCKEIYHNTILYLHLLFA